MIYFNRRHVSDGGFFLGVASSDILPQNQSLQPFLLARIEKRLKFRRSRSSRNFVA